MFKRKQIMEIEEKIYGSNVKKIECQKIKLITNNANMRNIMMIQIEDKMNAVNIKKKKTKNNGANGMNNKYYKSNENK